MDSRNLLDHALFQLTPTRTRCDLVIYAGGATEKLASGLLEPFVLHLKAAKDQISKGGYSVSLRPLPANAPWFTKATLQRFVRFVSTPEILERFVTIEKELDQIDSSVQSNEVNEDGAGDAAKEENSKVHLQRALETRKAVLHKEQAMAYARALVTGFELDSIHDLISFADAFGASRLREACINFIELCKKKNQDRLWMDEIAAMQASRLELTYVGTSGIVLAGEENYPPQLGGLSVGKQNGSIDTSDSATSLGSLDLNQAESIQTRSSDGKPQVQMPWPNHLPQYMHNFPGPMLQQMPPYQGYLYPGMQMAPPYFAGNMQWPPNVDDSTLGRDREPDDHRKAKSSSKKKSSHRKRHEPSDQENSSEPSDSSSETESDENMENHEKQSSGEQVHRKKRGKKSSRKVVIRNINYITSKRDGEKGSMSEETSDEDGFIDGEALKQQVEEAVGSLERQQRSSSRHHKKSQRKATNGLSDATDLENKNSSGNKLGGEKGNDPWGAFQSLLLKDKDSDSTATETQPLQFQEEYLASKKSGEERSLALDLEGEEVRKQRAFSNDSFIATNREAIDEGESRILSFEAGQNVQPIIKKGDRAYEEQLFSRGANEPAKYPRPIVSDYSDESLMIRSQREGDWFLSSQIDKPVNKDESMDLKRFNDDSSFGGFHFEKNKKDVIADDSFMIQARPSVDYQPDSLIKTDIPEIVEAQYENGVPEITHDKGETFFTHEPDDLYMVLDRDSAAEIALSSWMPEVDYEANAIVETTASDDKLPSNTNTKGTGGKVTGKEAKSKVSNAPLGRSKSDMLSRAKKPSSAGRTTLPKGKSDKEEERRKRMEELLIQRQKRIAERSASGSVVGPTKRTPVPKASTVNPTKNEKSPGQETKKTVFRSSTIDRLATARTVQKTPAQSKPSPPQKPSSKVNNVSKKSASAENKKPLAKTVKTDVPRTNEGIVTQEEKPMDLEAAAEAAPPTNVIDDFKDIKELPVSVSLEKNEGNPIPHIDYVHDKECSGDNQMGTSEKSVQFNEEEKELSKVSAVASEERKSSDQPDECISEITMHPLPASPNKGRASSPLGDQENDAIKENLHLPKTSEIEISATPPEQMNAEPIHSRKKWNSDENSPKAAKGFRKLLMFGRKSRPTATA
ncbi:hypothetical protein Tsubulata_005683 [Turnera subulata]|uniref:COP1-interacting protein 7 n=1 Tax=Turnera subulata TaxID=218843 RepID=A0A9Q0FDP5_9ROSI|nr:hypothetical protein Tsubulata_005683 [Turnera subulata]